MARTVAAIVSGRCDVATRVNYNGPVFDGRAKQALKDACEESERSIARLGAVVMRTFLNTVLKKQTPHYRLRMEAVSSHPGWKVWDQKCIYGPWLNGTGSRNRTTRFKGYAHLRYTYQKMREKAEKLCAEIVRSYMERV